MSDITPKDGGPAFPIPISNGEYSMDQGMSLRDWFAGQGLVGVLSNTRLRQADNDEVAKKLYAMADAMIEERKR